MHHHEYRCADHSLQESGGVERQDRIIFDDSEKEQAPRQSSFVRIQ